MDINTKVESYLKEHFGLDTRLLGMERLGEGMHGVVNFIKFRVKAWGQTPFIISSCPANEKGLGAHISCSPYKVHGKTEK